MKKVKRKEILQAVTNSLTSTLKKFAITSPSKKTKKILAKTAKEIARQLKGELKSISKKATSVNAPGRVQQSVRGKSKKVTSQQRGERRRKTLPVKVQPFTGAC